MPLDCSNLGRKVKPTKQGYQPPACFSTESFNVTVPRWTPENVTGLAYPALKRR